MNLGRIVAMLATMSETWSLSEVEAKLADLVASVSADQRRVVITVDGMPTAVLMAADELASLEETLAVLSDGEALRALGAALAEVNRGDVADAQSLADGMRGRRTNEDDTRRQR